MEASRTFAREYISALRNLPQIVKYTCFRRRTLDEELQEVRFPHTVIQGQPCKRRGSACIKQCQPAALGRAAAANPLLAPALQALVRGSMRKAIGGWDLLFLGLGIVIGSGWAQLTGMAAQHYAGCACKHPATGAVAGQPGQQHAAATWPPAGRQPCTLSASQSTPSARLRCTLRMPRLTQAVCRRQLHV